MKMEIWKPVVGYEGLYEVSNMGNVFSLLSNRNLDCGLTTKKYKRVCLSIEGEKKFHHIHRLVAEAFIPNPEHLPQVNHKDGNKQNNCVENLEWCDNSQNQYHAYDTGLKKKKLSSVDKNFIRENYIPRDKHYGTRALARRFGVSQTAVSKVIMKGGDVDHVKG